MTLYERIKVGSIVRVRTRTKFLYGGIIQAVGSEGFWLLDYKSNHSVLIILDNLSELEVISEPAR